MNTGWSQTDSPFHRGEQAIQKRLGVQDKLESQGRRVIRDTMPEEHREFYRHLPFALLGATDARGQVWASIRAGRPGFLDSPDPRRLRIGAAPLFGDPLGDALTTGADVGLLGIQPETRRRNRLTGRVVARDKDGFDVAIDQSFGNCPQYIQTRSVALLPAIDEPERPCPIHRGKRLDQAARTLIEGADTLFIATAYGRGGPGGSTGADVSHRGGKPGFVRVEDDNTLVFPDFSGNFHFNTVGNIQLNPKAGLLFMDFTRGDLLYLSGDAEIVWKGEALDAFIGAERLIHFRVAETIRVEGSLPLRFSFGEYSPMLEHTGSWQQAAATITAATEGLSYRDYEVFDIQRESETITSFYLRRVDECSLAAYEPGQFLPIRLTPPGETEALMRTYTLSDAPNGDHYRLSIKREPGAAKVSNFFHQHVKPGFRLQAMAPRGRFVLDRSSHRPVVLVSAGVGITPMIAMARSIIAEGVRTRHFRRTFFIHGAVNGASHAFGATIRDLAAAHPSLTAHIRYSRPGPNDRLGETHDSEGRVDLILLRQVLPLDDYDFYLCGPREFMQALYDGLTGLGIREQRIFYESFGPATVLKHDAKPTDSASSASTAAGPVKVRFTASGIEADWSPDQGTLLELAESAGLTPLFSCRSGICGTCATRIGCGDVDYTEEPVAPRGDREVLICCSTPRPVSGAQTCGEDMGVALDL